MNFADATDLIISRVNKGLCPICCKDLDNKEPITFTEHNGIRQPVHAKHIHYGESMSHE